MASYITAPRLLTMSVIIKSGSFDVGDAQLCAAGELLEAIQQGAAGQGCGGKGEIDSNVAESAAAGAAETIS